MTKPDHDPDVNSEPHLKKQSFTPDPAEFLAEQTLEKQKAVTEPTEERASHSVFDEPAVLPNRPPARIEEDWHCRKCGYNLRGLMTGYPCPECGQVERYEPPREGEESYSKLVSQYRSESSSRVTWVMVFTLMLAGLPLGIIGSFVSVDYAGAYMFIALGPFVSEIAKMLTGVMFVERSRYASHSETPIYVLTVGTAIIYALTQNALYLTLFYPNSSKELITWRFSLCIFLHVCCTLVATRGLVLIWQKTKKDKQPISLSLSFSTMIFAILLHAAYNALVFLGGHLGYGI